MRGPYFASFSNHILSAMTLCVMRVGFRKDAQRSDTCQVSREGPAEAESWDFGKSHSGAPRPAEQSIQRWQHDERAQAGGDESAHHLHRQRLLDIRAAIGGLDHW